MSARDELRDWADLPEPPSLLQPLGNYLCGALILLSTAMMAALLHFMPDASDRPQPPAIEQSAEGCSR